jgi:outer membrane protein TolC
MRALFFLLAASVASPAAASQDRSRVVTLERALALAQARNAELRRSALRIGSAEADQRLARAAMLPRVEVDASMERDWSEGGEVSGSFVDPVTGRTVVLRTPAQTFSTYAAGATLQQLLFDGGRTTNALRASDHGLAAARENMEEIRLQTAFVVEQRFYELVRAQRQLQVLTEAAARSRDQAQATQRLFDVGRQTLADVYAARTNRDNDEMSRIGQEARVELARQDLAVTIGVDPGEPIAIEEPPRLFDDPAPAPPVEGAIAKALASRPGLRALADAAESARRAAAATAGGYWPQISVVVGYQRRTWDLDTFASPPGKAGTVSAGVRLSWNLFDGFATNAQVAKALVEVQQAENDLADARRAVAAEVAKAVEQLTVARLLVRTASHNEGNAREGLKLARTRQEVGAGTQLDVRDAELKLTQSQLAWLGALVGGRVAEAALLRATGGR